MRKQTRKWIRGDLAAIWKKNNNIVLDKATNSLHYVDLLQENTLYTTLYQPLLIFTTV